MEKKMYRKPAIMMSSSTPGIVPLAALAATEAVAAGAALLGGYAAGRAVKSIMEFRQDNFNLRALKRVYE